MKYLLQHPEPIGADNDLLATCDPTAIARALEGAGWDGLAYTEHPAPGRRWLAQGGGHQTLDPFVALGAAAAVTERIRLLTYLAVIPYRNPLLLAKAAASVDMISKGRFVLGAGTGYLKGEFFALGVDFDERNELFDEALDWMPLPGPPEMAATTRTAHLGGLDDVAAAIRDVKDQAGDRAAELDFMVLYTDDSILRPDVDVERHRDALGQIRDAGATWVSFAWDFSTEAETLAFVDGFASTYLGADRI